MNKVRWSEQELQILKDNYKNESKEKVMRLLPNRTWMTILARGNMLKLKREYNKWTEREIQVLKNNYKNESKEKVMELLPNRTRDAIHCRACILKLKRAYGPGQTYKKQINEKFFDKWSDEMAYVLGFFVADGNMHCYQRWGRCVLFAQKEKEILIKIAKMMNWKPTIYFDKVKKTFSIRTYVRCIYNQLFKLGMTPRKSLTIKFPYVPKKYMRHFIRGVFDGDGGISIFENKSISCGFSSGSELFLKKLKEILLKEGINTSKIYRGKNIYLNKEPMIKLFHHMYNNVSKKVYMERKYNTFIKWFKYRGIKYTQCKEVFLI